MQASSLRNSISLIIVFKAFNYIFTLALATVHSLYDPYLFTRYTWSKSGRIDGAIIGSGARYCDLDDTMIIIKYSGQLLTHPSVHEGTFSGFVCLFLSCFVILGSSGFFMAQYLAVI